VDLSFKVAVQSKYTGVCVCIYINLFCMCFSALVWAAGWISMQYLVCGLNVGRYLKEMSEYE
jgi:hypothetical protein